MYTIPIMKEVIFLSLPDYRIGVTLAGPRKVPYRIHECIQGFIYNHVLGGTELGDRLHAAHRKHFSFAMNPFDGKREVDGLVSKNGQWELRISSARQDLLDHMLKFFCEEQSIAIVPSGKPFEIVNLAKEQHLNRNLFYAQTVTVRTMGPQDQRRYLHSDDENYEVALIRSLQNCYFDFWGQKATDNIGIRFTTTPESRIIQYKNRNMLAYTGPVKITGDRDLIRFAQCVGLGHKTGCGMGLII